MTHAGPIRASKNQPRTSALTPEKDKLSFFEVARLLGCNMEMPGGHLIIAWEEPA